MAEENDAPKRTTSFAKSLDTDRAETSRPLSKEFDRAQEPHREPVERTVTQRREPRPDRPTSFAKTLDPVTLPPHLKKIYDHALSAHNKLRDDRGREDTGRTVTPSHDPTNTLRPRPTGKEADAVDRKTFNDRQAKLARAEEAMRKLAERKGPEHDHDRGRSR